MKKNMRVLILASIVGYASAACSTTTAAKWGAAGVKSQTSATLTKGCIQRQHCAAAACSSGNAAHDTQAKCIAAGVCREKINGVCATAAGAASTLAADAVVGAVLTATTKANCDLETYTPANGLLPRASTTAGVFTPYTWGSAESWWSKTVASTNDDWGFTGSGTTTGTGTTGHTGLDTEWDTIKTTAGNMVKCGCWGGETAVLTAAGSMTAVKDCKGDKGHSMSRYCSADGTGWSTGWTYVQANKKVSPAPSPLTADNTYMSRTGVNRGTQDEAPVGAAAVCPANAPMTLLAASALDWKTNTHTVSMDGTCTAVAASSTSPAAALSGIASIFFAIMAML